jgi:adenosylcobinamide kinase/adenosylcobinamide-phosphate guanylyltransferase
MRESRADAGALVAVARSELILGGQKSGKSRRAEMLAHAWLARSPSHGALLVATAQPWDDEMRERIQRHRQDRAERVPVMQTVEEPLALAEALRRHSRAELLVVVDCLTLWLTNLLMPHGEAGAPAARAPTAGSSSPQAALSAALEQAPGPVVLVSNEIGLGVIPLGRDVRGFVDALGQLNQQMARVCARVTLMAAGLPVTLKDIA